MVGRRRTGRAAQLLGLALGPVTAGAVTWALWRTSTLHPNGDHAEAAGGPPAELAAAFVLAGLLAGAAVFLLVTRGVLRHRRG